MRNQSLIPADRPFANEVMRRPSLYALVPDQDEWETLQAAHGRAGEAIQEVRDATEIPHLNVLQEVDEALRSGKPIPDDFAERRARAQAAAEIRVEKIRALEKLRGVYAMLLAEIAEEAAPAMIRALDDELREVVEGAAELLAELGGSIDALAAIEAGKTDAFRDLGALHRQYVRIRSDADLILQEEDRALFKTDKGHRLFRGLARVWPTWRMVDTEYVRPGWSGPAPAPWPEDLASLDFFAWMLTHRDEAQPWVPSAEALHAVRAADGRRDEAAYQTRHAPDRPAPARRGAPGQVVFGPPV